MKIKNWNQFQHYKTRNPPWIRLHKKILDDPDWHALDGTSSKVLVMLWLLASEDDTASGKIPCPRKAAFRLRMTENQLNAIIPKLSHWLEQDASTALAGCLQVAPKNTPETDNSETDNSETDNSETDTGAKAPYGIFGNVLLSASELSKLKEKFGDRCDDKINALSEYMQSRGRRYKDHYATILNWARRDGGGDDKVSIDYAAGAI